MTDTSQPEKPLSAGGFIFGCIIIAAVLFFLWQVSTVFIHVVTALIRIGLLGAVVAFFLYIGYLWLKNHKPSTG